MDRTKSSVTKLNPKPVSVFYVWYSELCRRLSLHPSPAVRPAKPKCQTVLDFVADRLKTEEWTPIISALKQDTSLHVISIRSRVGNCQFLHDVDTEEKARNMKRKYGTIWTAYVMRQLLKSVSSSLRNTQVLSYLELDGLPLFMQYLEPLMQALKKNQTLKTLSFSNSNIQDPGCQMVCSYLRFTPNVEVLNLSGCQLSQLSGEHIAKLIKYQQINRYCESWHNSLRYANPDTGKMRGIKRITINCNPFFGDSGLGLILNELEDDLWIKALDVQKCGLTESIATRIIDTVVSNNTLEIVDLRQNESLDMSTMEQVLLILKQRQPSDPEFQWCDTAVTLAWDAVSSTATFVTNRTVHKTRSAPMKNVATKVSELALRKTKTTEFIPKKASLEQTKQQVMELNEKLQKEIQKRKQMEKINQQLKSQLSQIKSNVTVTTNGIKKDVSTQRKRVKVPQNPLVVIRKKETNKLPVVTNGYHKNGIINGMKKFCSNGMSKNLTNGSVYNIFEKFLSQGQDIHDDDEEDMLNYFTSKNTKRHCEKSEESVSNSQISLYKYMEELKTNN